MGGLRDVSRTRRTSQVLPCLHLVAYGTLYDCFGLLFVKQERDHLIVAVSKYSALGVDFLPVFPRRKHGGHHHPHFTNRKFKSQKLRRTPKVSFLPLPIFLLNHITSEKESSVE